MQYSTVFLAALAAGASAAPWNYGENNKDTSITINLSGPGELSTNTVFKGDPNSKQQSAPVGSSGEYNQISVKLGKDFPNKDLRCQVVGENHDTLVATRGANIDINFSDGGEAKPWTFLTNVNVTNIICDPALKKITPEELAAQDKTTVTLDAQGVKHIDIGGFTGKAREEKPTNSHDKFTEVTIKVGKFTNPQGLRCQILDHRDRAIEAKRGANIDTTFSDAGKGKWTFLVPEQSVVKTVICDPAFKSANAPTAPAPQEPTFSILPVNTN